MSVCVQRICCVYTLVQEGHKKPTHTDNPILSLSLLQFSPARENEKHCCIYTRQRNAIERVCFTIEKECYKTRGRLTNCISIVPWRDGTRTERRRRWWILKTRTNRDSTTCSAKCRIRTNREYDEFVFVYRRFVRTVNDGGGGFLKHGRTERDLIPVVMDSQNTDGQ